MITPKLGMSGYATRFVFVHNILLANNYFMAFRQVNNTQSCLLLDLSVGQCITLKIRQFLPVVTVCFFFLPSKYVLLQFLSFLITLIIDSSDRNMFPTPSSVANYLICEIAKCYPKNRPKLTSSVTIFVAALI